jgi:glycine/D-amino acid oxidase-like deaminating enzyme
VPALPGSADGSATGARPVPGERRLPGAAGALNTGAVFWLEQALAAEAAPVACPPLAGALSADFCIVGGGYTGLWCALDLKEQAPDASVVVLEAGACGFGASGRNGGWMTSWVDELDGLVARFGEEQALWLADESSATIGRIEQFTQEHGIDCHFRQAGGLWIASAPPQVGIVREAVTTAARLGRGHLVEEVSGDEVAARTGTRVASGGALIKDSAAVQPALLARGLRRVAIERGIRIFEGAPMIRLERTRPAIAVTPAGRVSADQVVLATNAWSGQVRELRRTVALVGSQIVLSEPIPQRLAEFGWADGTLLGDARLFVHYAQVTRDGRIAFGRGGGALGPASRVVAKHFYDPTTAASVAGDFRRWFPQLADVRLTHAWGGAVDRAPGHLPFVGALGDHANVHYGLGYSGNGVGPSALIGRILARRALATGDEYATCALVGVPPGYLPPEPLRFAGGALVRSAVRRAEEREEMGRAIGPTGRLAKRLVTFSLPPLRRRPRP